MQLRPPKNPGRVAIVGVGLLLATTLLILAGTGTDTSPAGGSRPSAIEEVFPAEGSVIRAQETVGVDLRDDLTGIIIIDGNRIPEDQYSGSPNLGVFQYRPGEDQEFEEFEPGEHAITIEWWPAELQEDDARAQGKTSAYAWRFKVA